MESDVTRYFYKGGLNCAESTLRCLIEKGVIDAPPDAVRMMTGFGGRTEPEKPREPSAAAVREFLRRFEAAFGTLTCRELQAVYVKEHALKSEGMYRACTVFVKKAAELTEQILREQREKA